MGSICYDIDTEVMQMKKMLSVILAAVMLTILICIPIHAGNRQIPVYIGNTTVEGVLIEDTTFVPFDTFCYAMGADSVTWDPKQMLSPHPAAAL